MWGIFNPSEPSYAVQLGQALKWGRIVGIDDGEFLLVVAKLSRSLRYDIGDVVKAEAELEIITADEARQEKKARKPAPEEDDSQGGSNLSQPSNALSDRYDGIEAPTSPKKGDEDDENEEDDRIGGHLPLQ